MPLFSLTFLSLSPRSDHPPGVSLAPDMSHTPKPPQKPAAPLPTSSQTALIVTYSAAGTSVFLIRLDKWESNTQNSASRDPPVEFRYQMYQTED